MRILLTGASGLVGAAFAEVAARRGHAIIGIVGSWPTAVPGVDDQRAADLTDQAAVQRLALDIFPDAIVNAAAIADPATCDRDPHGSELLNTALPKTLAQVAHHIGGRFIHLSSEQVFDGTRPPYAENSEPNPLNRYGRQKLASEQLVLAEAGDECCIIRPPLLSGNSLSGNRSVHERLFSAWLAGRHPRLFTDEIRQPCSADNLAEVMVELCERTDIQGVVHWAGLNALSRFDIARRILDHFKLAADLVEPVTRSAVPGSASRPANLTLNTEALGGILKTRRQSFSTQLEWMKVPPPARSWYFQTGQ